MGDITFIFKYIAIIGSGYIGLEFSDVYTVRVCVVLEIDAYMLNFLCISSRSLFELLWCVTGTRI